jgi:hypothetical protein
MTPDIQTALNRWAAGESWQQAFMPRRSYRNGIRDRHLVRVGELVGFDAGEVHRLCNTFVTRIWPRWSNLEQPPENAGLINATLFLARKAAPLPDSRKQIKRIIDNYPRGNVQ